MGSEKIHILIVDDNELNRMVLNHCIKDIENTSVSDAENGFVALQYILSHKDDFFILILDIDMPVMNGIELINLLSANNGSIHNIKIIMQSSHSISYFKTFGVDKFVLEYFQKPVQKTILRNQVITAIQSFESSNMHN